MPDSLYQGEALAAREREAIVDLLELCLLADSHIALRERHYVAQVVEVIGWNSAEPFEAYEPKAVARALVASESESQAHDFVAYAAQRLTSPASRKLAFQFCTHLFASDSKQPVGEMALWTEIRRALA